jgi:hypothetical protein
VRLDELPWEQASFVIKVAAVGRVRVFWLETIDRYRILLYSEDIHHTIVKDYGAQCPLMAQAILYHLLGESHETSDGSAEAHHQAG